MAWGHGNLGGGAAGFPVGMILVSYPENSILTISAANGGKYSKNDISDTQRMYYIKDFDTYRITATEKTTHESTWKDVNMRYLGQAENVTLSYSLYIIRNGIVETMLSARPWKYRANSSSVASSLVYGNRTYDENEHSYYLPLTTRADSTTYAAGVFETQNDINLKDWATMYVKASISCESINTNNSTVNLCVADRNNVACMYSSSGTNITVNSTNIFTGVSNKTAQTYYVDVSNIAASYDLYLATMIATGSSNKSVTVNVYDWWLEKAK